MRLRSNYLVPNDARHAAVRAAVRAALSFACLIVACLPHAATAFEPGSEEFFEQKIRPVLVEHCYRCHSNDADEIGASLWLDSADGMQEGGDSGPVIRAGDADASLLVSAIRYESSEMPPDQPLSKEVVDDFVRWINAGARDPRTAKRDARHAAARESIDLETGRQFWAFRPIQDFRRDLPPEQRSQIDLRLIDHQIGRTLDQHGITSNDAAEPNVVLRRLCFDLTGLPPSPDLRQRWLRSPNRDTWNKTVDELLNSRAFAQHWARHWMDISRYADSNGSDFNATFHDAWRYRDYLVDSFDSDRPLDEMIRQQIAGDLLPAETDRQRHDNVVATTFLMLGPKMLSERSKPKLTLDVVDEQIDTIGRAYLGMTLGCARCHDHKFDPIPTEDYYALAGIFKSTQTLNGESQKYVSTWNRVELPTSDDHREAIANHKSQKASLEKQIEAATKELADAKSHLDSRLIVDDSDAKKTGNWAASTYTKGFIGSGYVHDNNSDKGQCKIEFRKRLPASGRYVVRFAFSHSSNRAAAVPVTILSSDGEEQVEVNQQKKGKAPPWSKLGEFEFSTEEDAVVTIANVNTDGYVIADAVQFLPVGEDGKVETAQSEEVAGRIEMARAKLGSLEEQLASLKKDTPPPVPVAMAPRDFPTDQIGDSEVHIRGEVNNLGKRIPRGFLQVCGPGNASIPAPAGSGRIELAQWLTDPDHPLVARVIVNRVWMHVFGQGIVRTVDNFGARGDRPSHPELLDALAIDFMRDGWRLKPLLRRMLTSEAYARSSRFDADANADDPENRLFWRANRKRLTAESIRDAMLSAADALTDDEPVEPVASKGVLVTKNSGDTKEVASGIETPVRSMYLPVIRGNLSPLLVALDAADPDMLVGKRPTTNVPGQALVLVNSEHVAAWAKATADKIFGQHANWDERVRAVYRRCLSREPSNEDLELALKYLETTPDSADPQDRERLQDLVAAIFAATEFRYLD